MRNRLTDSIVAAAVLLLSSAALAQTVGQPPPAKPTAEKSQPFNPHDLTGVWLIGDGQNNQIYNQRGQEPPMTPETEAKYTASHGTDYQAVQDATTDPVFNCDPYGTPRVYLYPHPFKIVHTPSGEIVFLMEVNHVFHEIYMDGREHPADPDPQWFGHSTGKWDGDTLVIDTVGFNDKTWLDRVGHPHSEALHTVERWRRTASDTLELNVTIDDPKAYTKPWSGQKIFKLRTGWDILESICVIQDEIDLRNKNVIREFEPRAK